MGENKKTDAGGPRLGRTEQRPYPVLWLSIGIRAAHQVGAAVFLATYLLAPAGGPSLFYILLASLSGVALAYTEWLRHRQLYREVAGVVTIGKCLLLGAALHGFLPARAVVLAAFLLAAFGAHAPKNIRHRLLP